MNPFFIVILLTMICIILSVKSLSSLEQGVIKNFLITLEFWRNGFFSLLGFTLQMMMILVFGYCLAIYKPIYSFLRKLADLPQTHISAAVFIAGIAMIAGLLNWGFGLIVGALLARFVTIALREKGVRVHAGLLAACGALGMAVWHGGFSGSAPLKVAEKDHFLEEMIGVIPISDSILSSFNSLVTSGLFLAFVITAFILASVSKSSYSPTHAIPLRAIPTGDGPSIARWVGILMLLIVGVAAFQPKETLASFFDLNLVNFTLFALVLVVYKSLDRFTESVGEGIKSSVDIFIQFPFYAGILGMLSDSGVLSSFSTWVFENSSAESLPVYTFVSAAVVNFFVPSGGGQWAVQGPILMDAAVSLHLPLGKMVMAFSYGDQISNLLQPFWLLPLLAITGVSAAKILKFSFWFFLVGFIYVLGVMFFLF
ncbi:TIGR00366 family protein [Algoriphagus namhaensis]|uniref:TIGR00366 family protein n=1 Tax=Algoriphagus namhaensis TaxID=915353 RepID=A0ABV8ASU4_9BACT